MTNTIIHYGNLPVWLSYIILALMAAYLSVFIGLFAYATTLWSRGNDFFFFLLAPLVWTSLDYFRSSFTPLAFSWLGLGYSQFNAPIIIQGAEYTGVFGLTWLIVYVNAAIYYAAQKAMARQKLLAFLGSAFILPALWAAFGWQAYPATTAAMQEGFIRLCAYSGSGQHRSIGKMESGASTKNHSGLSGADPRGGSGQGRSDRLAGGGDAFLYATRSRRHRRRVKPGKGSQGRAGRRQSLR